MSSEPENVSEVGPESGGRRKQPMVPLSNSVGVTCAVLIMLVGIGEAALIWQQGAVSLLETTVLHMGAALATLVIGRRLARRSRLADAIVSSVRGFASGERSMESLQVGASYGPLATAFNRILEERDAVETQNMSGVFQAEEANDDHGGRAVQTALDGLWHGVALVDSKGKISAINGAARVLLGVVSDDAINAEYQKVFTDKQIAEAVGAVVSRRERSRVTFELSRGEAEAKTVLRVSVKPVLTDPGSAVLIVEDVTQLRVADESRASMMAHTVHELRTPLSNVRLYVEEALDSDESDVEIRGRCLNVINQEARRLERMVADMLSVSEIESGSLTLRAGDVRLDQLFDELRVDYQASAEDKQIKLTFDMPPKLPVIRGDRDKLAVALHNLIGNAIKYTPAGGAVDVRVASDAEALKVEVADTGIGIDPAEQGRIFERFHRASDPRVADVTGTGLGLTLAREVARLHGGDITVTSEPDKGSCFTLSVPITDHLAAAA